MAIVSGKVLHKDKHIVIALTYIFGVGRSRAALVCKNAGVQPDKKVKDLVETQLEAIRQELAKFTLEGDLRRSLAMAIKLLMDIGCYRGVRHRRRLPCRGQRTKTNASTRKRGKKT